MIPPHDTLTPEDVRQGRAADGLFKFVRLSTGEVRLFQQRARHSQAVEEGEVAVGAGTISLREWRGDMVVEDGYSSTLKVSTTQEDKKALSALVGLPIGDKWD